MGAKEEFLKVYANLPVPERAQIIAIIGDETYSWNTAHIEISNNTKLGEQILKKLRELEIL